ncbi:peroxidase family protein [Gammaproteobacteria bacterium]|nr:peroxidase family protein [Gammaproteobacteria bacterium]
MKQEFKKIIPSCMATILICFSANASAQQRNSASGSAGVDVRSLDGTGNNLNANNLGSVNTIYRRLTKTSYADGVAQPYDGPNTRYISNRIFNDNAQNIFSVNSVTQWAPAWGQFIDHTIGLRDQGQSESAAIAFDPLDPLEQFQNDLGTIAFARTAPAPGTGIVNQREQLNIVSSYIDGWAIYGGTTDRLEWLRVGPVDGDMGNNRAELLMTPNGYLPRATARDSSSAPAMELNGRLMAAPNTRMIAGDVRANENTALTALHTLFAREHNRLISKLPTSLSEEQKFQIARRLIGAMQQYITYNEFLPAMGVRLKRYQGYDSRVDPSVSNEFAVVGYRAHSMIHGEIEMEVEPGQLNEETLQALEKHGVEIESGDEHVELAVPLNSAYFNPDLLELLGLGNILAGLASEAQYKNDEQIDNQLRSVMFQIPSPTAVNPRGCLDGELLSDCFTMVLDLGAIDIERGRDHGVALYNDLREAYGLSRVADFMQITGEASEEFDDSLPAAIDNPESLDFVKLLDIEGNEIAPGTDAAEGEVVVALRKTTLAARLKAIYAAVDDVDAFVGMVSEPHVPGTELGELQLAIWKAQFEALRDGDRFFYANDRELRRIEKRYGLSYKRRLAQIVADNTHVQQQDLPYNIFSLTSRQERTKRHGTTRQTHDRR